MLLIALPLGACTRPVELINLTSGASVAGTCSWWDRSMAVTLPTGETATGSYTKLTMEEIRPQSLFFGANLGDLLGRRDAERIYGYARLTGERGAVVEIIFASNWLGHGYGVARTSLKEEYRVTF